MIGRDGDSTHSSFDGSIRELAYQAFSQCTIELSFLFRIARVLLEGIVSNFSIAQTVTAIDGLIA